MASNSTLQHCEDALIQIVETMSNHFGAAFNPEMQYLFTRIYRLSVSLMWNQMEMLFLHNIKSLNAKQKLFISESFENCIKDEMEKAIFSNYLSPKNPAIHL